MIQAWLGFMETARRNRAVAIRELRRAEELMGGNWLEAVADKAENHVIDEAVLNVLHLKMNYVNDPVLEEPRLVEVFSCIQGE